MIKFKTVPTSEWVKGDHPIFDNSELEKYSDEERAKLEFQVFPFTPGLMKRIHKETKGNDDAYHKKALVAVIPGWRGILDENGNEVEWSFENMVKIFDGGYPRLGACLIRYAIKMMARFDEDARLEKEQDLKNLHPSQAGLGDEEKT